jgi:hypothetical protein
MTTDAPRGDEPNSAYFLEKEAVRTQFQAASYEIWLGLIRLLAMRQANADIATQTASSTVNVLSDLSRMRCRPDGRPLEASAVLEALYFDAIATGKSPLQVVEQVVVEGHAGEQRSDRSLTEITSLVEAFLQFFTNDYERGELTWVDELYGMYRVGGSDVSWVLDVPHSGSSDADGTILLRIPAAALTAAFLWPGDKLILDPRLNGLWIGRA